MERKIRGRPFKPGNAGRPPGSKNKVTQMAERLAEGQAEQLFQKVLELGQGGDVSCLRMLLDRLWPLRKGRPISLDMPRIDTSNDLLAVMSSIWNAIGDGRLTPEEAGALSLVAERSMQIIELQDVIRRVNDLEKKVRSNNEG